MIAMGVAFLFMILCRLDINGYVETRPYVLWGDSTRLSGVSRAWIEGKAAYLLYGGHVGVTMQVPYDTIASAMLQESVTISRCAVWVGPEQARVIIGKQRIDLGVGRVFRPLDVFNPVNYFEPGYERSGVNAVMGYYGFDRVTSVRAIYTPTFDWQNTTAGINFRATFLHTDVGISAIHQPERPLTLVGGDIAGELLVGYWGEYVFVQDDDDDYSRYVVGLDYSFPLRIYAMAEFFFDGSGVNDPAQYDFNDIITGRRQTLAQHYLYCSLSTIPLPFNVLRPAMNVLVNFDDTGIILIPHLDIVPFDNIDIAVGLNIFLGPVDGEFVNRTSFNGTAYIWAKVYF
jgi:hypothetical protein